MTRPRAAPLRLRQLVVVCLTAGVGLLVGAGLLVISGVLVGLTCGLFYIGFRMALAAILGG